MASASVIPDSVRLCANDTSGQQQEVEVPLQVACMSKTLKNLFEDLPQQEGVPSEAIPLPNVKFSTLQKVIEFCIQHKDDPELTEEQQQENKAKNIEGWDKTYLEDLALAPLFELILAANFLDIKPLLDLTCKSVAHMLRGKTPDEIKNIFGVVGNFTQEEEDQVRRDNEWLGDKPSGLVLAPSVAAIGGPTVIVGVAAAAADMA